jgi:hypothetical protein
MGLSQTKRQSILVQFVRGICTLEAAKSKEKPMGSTEMSVNSITLPEHYEERGTLDLKKDKKSGLAIQLLFGSIVVLMVVLARWFEFPVDSSWNTAVSILATVGMAIAYIMVHELTHGIVIRIISGVRADYFFRFPFVCTGSKVFFNKASFISIALAPVVLWGIVLIVLLLVLPPDYFLSMYILIGLNFAGAAGDYVQTYAISKLPPSALIQDDGKQSRVFLAR